MTRSRGCSDFSSFNNTESEHKDPMSPMLYDKRRDLFRREFELQKRIWKLNHVHRRIGSPITDSVKSLMKQKNNNQGKKQYLKSLPLESIDESRIKEFHVKQHHRSKNNEPTWGYFVDSNSTY